MYKAILFDLSNTLIEYHPNYADIYGDRLRQQGFTVTDQKGEEISRTINWTINEELQKEQNGKTPLTHTEMNSLLDFASLQCVCSDTEATRLLPDLSKLPLQKQQRYIIDGVIPVLEYLRQKYILGVVSNHKVWMLDYLKECGLAPYFQTIVISDIVGVAKPDPQIMKIALDELGLPASECLYVGDQPFDILCSKKAGLDCVWITTDGLVPTGFSYKEDYRINHITELKNIL